MNKAKNDCSSSELALYSTFIYKKQQSSVFLDERIFELLGKAYTLSGLLENVTQLNIMNCFKQNNE